jgi:hypothetical protein
MNNKIKISVQWAMDDNPDLDFLGKYVNSVSDYNCYVDRKHNILVDKMMTISKTNFDSLSSYEQYINELDYFGIGYDDNTFFAEDYDDENSYEILHWHYQNLPYKCNWYGDASCCQYIVSINFDPLGNEEEYRYIIEDVKRLEDYWHGRWHMEGCVAVAYIGDVELSSDACYGYESDMNNITKKDIEKVHIEECKSKALSVLKELSEVDIDNVVVEVKSEEFEW